MQRCKDARMQRCIRASLHPCISEMSNLYLLDKPFGENGVRLAQEDATAEVVLIQDGVYLDPRPLLNAGKTVYAVQLDVERRGLQQRLPPQVQRIDYAQLVDLIVAHKVINFA